MTDEPPESIRKWKCNVCKYELKGQMCQLKKCSNCGSLGSLELMH